ncbi:hypothetical protein HK405_012205, partial [Cladochytrium tenue]
PRRPPRAPVVSFSGDGRTQAQSVELDDELTVNIQGFTTSSLWAALFRLLGALTFGLLFLLSRWFTDLRLRLTARPAAFETADTVRVETVWRESTIVPLLDTPVDAETLQEIFADVAVSELPPCRQRCLLGGRPHYHLRHFSYRYMRFSLNPCTKLFDVDAFWKDPLWLSSAASLRGLDGLVAVARRRNLFGTNEIAIREKSTLELLVDEVLHPFFVFQIASMVLWCLDSYYYYAACILAISTGSAVTTLMDMKESYARLRSISKFSCPVSVFRGGQWEVVASEDLAVGDLFEVTTGMGLVPCDAVLLHGDCITNESMLTGESVPVSKTPASEAELRAMDFRTRDPSSTTAGMSRYFLFSGTKIVRSRSGALSDRDGGLAQRAGADHGAVALAVRVGFNTTKGALVRSILFPKPHTFQFYRDSFRFIGVLSLIASLGFLASVYNSYRFGESWKNILVRALDLITIVVPPALPATMAVGVSFSMSRLKKQGIFCISPPRVNICGKIQVNWLSFGPII